MGIFTFDSRWDTIKGRLRQRFSQLTDDDLAFVQGKGEELLGRLRKKLQLRDEDLRELLDDLYVEAERLADSGRSAAGAAAQLAADAGHTAADLAGKFRIRAAEVGEEARVRAAATYERGRIEASRFREDGEQYVRQNPIAALAIAVAAGFVAGLVLRRR